ncbi:hypothetical protein GCM10009663_37460 [Kitasatospora arboriphila]|uniref:Secreted protein n=1 Tax=Kitasatospora arboriphila TaxID=258052 RepID=A0ABN1TJX9_9ACTN
MARISCWVGRGAGAVAGSTGAAGAAVVVEAATADTGSHLRGAGGPQDVRARRSTLRGVGHPAARRLQTVAPRHVEVPGGPAAAGHRVAEGGQPGPGASFWSFYPLGGPLTARSG